MGQKGGAGETAAPPKKKNWGNLDFLGSKRNLGKVNFSRRLHVCVRVVVCLFVFFFKRESYFKLKSAW